MTKPKSQCIIRKNIDHNDVEVMFADAVAIVRANSFEMMCLWKTWHQEHKKTWAQDRQGGQLVTIGYIGGNKNRPVCISVQSTIIEGRRVIQVEDTSRWVDHTMIDEWLRASFPNISSHDDSNAMNFSNIMHYIARLNETEKVAA